ncbi:type I methionyl aminopeptidase [Candidatus Babeliales bacterium]|nr:type I methionyl aminopeptidase [Candidatus Babeliales bacterium]
MVYIKDKRAINKMRTAGKLLSHIIVREVPQIIKEGVSSLAIDNFIEAKMREVSLKPECKGYKGYQYATCVSINDVLVHGVPSNKVILKDGDLVKIDVVASYKSYCVDMARYFFVGKPSKTAEKLMQVAENALNKAIDQARVGNRVRDISTAVEKEVETEGFGVVRDFAGHGVGKYIHEAPEIPNFRTENKGPILQIGMTLAIEPMITEKDAAVYIDSDGWTARTKDGGLAGHIEDTVLVTEEGPEVLTRLGD